MKFYWLSELPGLQLIFSSFCARCSRKIKERGYMIPEKTIKAERESKKPDTAEVLKVINLQNRFKCLAHSTAATTTRWQGVCRNCGSSMATRKRRRCVVSCCLHCIWNLYVPISRDRTWHLPQTGGCQRVVEPILSPLLYKFLFWRLSQLVLSIQIYTKKCLTAYYLD